MGLENLAQNGIVDFDADAYIKGEPPKFVGKPYPTQYLPFDEPLPVMPEYYGKTAYPPRLTANPGKDAFISRVEKEKVKLPWKEALTVALVGGAAIFSGFRVTSCIKNIKNRLTASPTSNTSSQSNGFFSSLFSKISTSFKTFFTSRWGKISAISAAVLLGLYGLYKIFSGDKNQN